MAMEILTLTIDEHGDMTSEVSGVVGKGCHAIQEALAEKLGQSVRVEQKPEYHQQPIKKVAINNSR